jgi:hypothetical protein
MPILIFNNSSLTKRCVDHDLQINPVWISSRWRRNIAVYHPSGVDSLGAQTSSTLHLPKSMAAEPGSANSRAWVYVPHEE